MSDKTGFVTAVLKTHEDFMAMGNAVRHEMDAIDAIMTRVLVPIGEHVGLVIDNDTQGG